ncbi:hemicentin-1-like [Schistocerca americana]|uniref:hemicentin-1-like n=1 Tax=Schistocerca americana TaxID=7009 RepID=UPI001F4FF51F|nr:hemicentin-1-like [Schistocerca americana]
MSDDANYGKEGLPLPPYFAGGDAASGDHDRDPTSEYDHGNTEDGTLLFRMPPTSLAFVFDTTGSMHDDLAQARRGTDGIMEILKRHQDVVDNYILVPFNDPDVGPVTVTSDAEEFKHALRMLQITSGGDCPEMSLKAIQLAISHAKLGAHIYVFTDASSKDYYLSPQVLALIQRKQSKVVFILTGDCNDTDKPNYQVYEDIAATSLGQVFHLNKTDVKQVLNYVRESFGLDSYDDNEQKVDLLSVNKPNATKDEQHNLYIDESVKEFTVSVSGKNSELALVNPDGEDIKGPPKANPLLNLKNVKVFNVEQPEPGEWKVKVSSESGHTVRSKGVSDINFAHGFSRVATDKFKETSHRPLKGAYNSVLIKPTHQKKISKLTQLKLIDMKGNVIQEINLEPVSKKKHLYRGFFMPPNELFYLEINGIDKDGFPIKRITPTAIEGQEPDGPVVTAEKEITAVINKPITLRCQVESLVPFSIKWIKDGQLIKKTEKYEQSGVSVLHIDSVTIQSQGDYKCFAINTAGRASQITTLKVTGPPPQVTTLDSVTSPLHTDTILNCVIQSELPYNWSWVRGDEGTDNFLEGKIHQIEENERVHNLSNGSLLIKQVKEDDRGSYFCVAENKGGMGYGKTHLGIVNPIKVYISPSLFEFTRSQTVRLLCNTDDNSTAEFLWMKDGDVLTGHNTKTNMTNHYSHSVLHIDNATHSDEGIYKCEGTRGEQKDVAQSVVKYVEAPTITPLERELFIEKGNAVTLKCLITGIPTPTVHWYRNGKELIYSESEEKNFGMLKILSVDIADSGEYICSAENHLASAEGSLWLNVGVPPQVLQPSEDVKVEFGSDATIPCVTAGIPHPKVIWQRKDGKQLDSKRFIQTETGLLKIMNSTLDDEAVYICTAENSYGSVKKDFPLKITGIVEPTIEDAGEHPIVITFGQPIEFKCEAHRGIPAPTITWYKDGKILDDKQAHRENVSLHSNGSLIIPNVSHEHEGTYECKAQNAVGTAAKSFLVTVNEPPSFKSGDHLEQNVNLGEELILHCEPEGDPKPVISWKKERMPLQESKDMFIRADDDALIIRQASLDDSGTYTCTAVNSVGSADRHMVVNVQVKPVIDDAGEHRAVVSLGQVAELPCKIRMGIPSPNMTWYKDGEILDEEQMLQEGITLHSNGSLIIPYVSHEHEGTYECEAQNPAGFSTKSILVTIIEPPRFKSVAPLELKVALGEEVVLPCEPTGDPKPLISWKKDRMPLQQSEDVFIRSEDNAIIIKKATPESSGTYVCTAVNSAGSAEKQMDVFVQVAPVISNMPTRISAVDGQIVTLNCKAEGIPSPVITWLKNEQPITLYKKDIIFLDNNSTVRFLANNFDSGSYKCVARNIAGLSSQEIKLSVFVPPKIHPPSEELIHSSLGQVIILNCHVTGSPEPTVIWRKNEDLIYNTTNLSISRDGNLHIHQADLDSAGIYACDAENDAGITEKLFYVIVHAPPQIVDAIPSKIELMAGESLSVACSAYGSPMPHLSWRRNGYTILRGEDDVTVSDDNSLTIIAASHQNSGLYSCVAENSEGSDQKNVVIDVLVPPSMIEPEDGVLEVNEGDSLVITCPAIDASPPPKIQWLKDGHIIDFSDEDHYSLRDLGRSLELQEVALSDRGTYSCLAYNIVGRTTATFTVDILRKPQFPASENQVQQMQYTVVASSDIKLECPVTGHPRPQISWQKNGHPITPSTVPSAVLSKNKQFLLINNAKPHDGGTYTCIATNKVGQNERSFEVTVMVPPTIDGPSEEDLGPVKGDIVLLQCPASGDPEPDIRWSKDGDRTLFIQKDNVILSPDFKILEISNVQSEDGGHYICEVINNAGSTKKHFNVTIIDPPEIEDDFVEHKIVRLGDNLSLVCKAHGYPSPAITWLHNGRIINELNSTDRFSAGIVSGAYVLQINGIQVSDKGKYSCLASNIAGVSEKDYNVAVNVPPKLAQALIDDTINSIIGSPVIIKCPADGNPKPDIYWFKDGTPVRNDKIRASDTLYISKSTVEDSGNYTCVATNNVGNTSRSFQVDVYVPPVALENEEETEYKVKANNDLILNCSVSGYPHPDILWFKGSTPVTPSNWPQMQLREMNTILVIPNVTRAHGGKYSCLAINKAGTTEQKFNVEIQEPPSVVPGIPTVQNHPVKLHQRTVLKCALDGSPAPTYTWYKNGIPLVAGTSENIYISSDGKQLHLMYALEDDVGLYSCIAENPAGYEQMAFQLKVEAPAEWGAWSGWSECSTTCGPGQQVRKRECVAPHIGCQGDNEEWRNCYMAECQVHGGWSGWSEWSECSASCGLANRKRYRRCDSPNPAYGGNQCQGADTQEEYCHQPPCPIHGGWSEWSDWGSCSVSCGYGVKYRGRHCANPRPDYGGKPCVGSTSEMSTCNMQKCPVDGGWSEWGAWSQCSATCGLGNKQRFRTCTSPMPANGGAFCSGENLQVEKCILRSCDNVPMYAALRIRGHLNGENLTDYVISANISDFGLKRTIEASVSDVLKQQGGWFPYLTFMLSPISWNAAYEEDQADNGYSLTHGKFRQQSQVEFSSGEELKLRHIGHGISDDGILQVDIDIEGEVPVVQPEAAIQIQPYEEDYVQTGPDTLYAASSNVLKINGLKLPYSWNNTVQYDKYKGRMPYLVEKLSTDDIGIQYDAKSREIKYRMSTAIRKKYNNNMCPEGFVHDDKHSHCRDIDECSERQLNRCHLTQICENLFGTYRCYCRAGYKSNGIGKRCVDINECLVDPSVCSHHCQNVKGSFRCLCPPGYNLMEDRRTCTVSGNENWDYDEFAEWTDSFEDRNKYMPHNLNVNRPVRRPKKPRTHLPKQFFRSLSSHNDDCELGFAVKNGICEDINECNSVPKVCTNEQTCLNKKGSYLCLNTPCPEGYERDPQTNYCLIYCDERHTCNEGAKLTQTVSFMVLTPETSSIQPYQDLMQFSVQGDNGKQLPRTRYRIVENELGKPFRVRFENGQGILYSLKNLGPGRIYRTSVLALSYDTDEKTILHTTKFIVFIDLPSD